MSIHLQSMAWKFSLSNSPYKQKSNIKLVLIKLCDNASDEGYCWPSMGRIARECELSRRSVVDQISKLKDMGLIEVEHRFKDNEQTSNGYQINIDLLSRGELLAPPSETHSHPPCKGFTQNHNLTIKESSDTEHFSKEKRIDVFSLEGYEYCKSAIEYISLCKENSPNLYDGPLTIGDWDSCEDKLREVLSEPIECEGLIYNIYRERRMGRKKSVSLPYILMTFTDTDEFSHLATNCNDWTEVD